jgi:hypothetical protein
VVLGLQFHTRWYGNLFGGPKWGNGDIKVEWERENDPCDLSSLTCVLQPLIDHEGELKGKSRMAIFGGTLGAKLSWIGAMMRFSSGSSS